MVLVILYFSVPLFSLDVTSDFGQHYKVSHLLSTLTSDPTYKKNLLLKWPPSLPQPRFAVTPSPMADMPSPANASSSSGPGSNHSGGGSGVGSTVVPQGVEQIMFNYINITTLFLGAHEMWEQAEAMAQRGSGKNSQKRFCFFFNFFNN